MARADIQAGRAYVSLYVKQTAFEKALKGAQKRLNAFGDGLLSVGTKAAAMGAGILGSLAGAVAHFASVGDQLDKMSLRTGVSATALAELGFAAEQSGASMETVESALKRMQKNLGGIGPESIKTAAALDSIGLSIEGVQSLSPEDQFQLIAERIGDIEDPSKRAAAAMAVFGEGGRQLLPMLESIRALRAEAKGLGIAPSQDSVKAAAEITDAINRVRRVIGATIFEIGAAIAPMAQSALAEILRVVSGLNQFVKQNQRVFATIVKVGIALGAAGTAAIVLGLAFKAAAFSAGIMLAGIGFVKAALIALSAVATGTASIVTTAFFAMFAAIMSPLTPLLIALAPLAALLAGVVAVAAVAALRGIDFAAAWDGVRDSLARVMAIAKEVGAIILAALSTGSYVLAMKAAWAGIKIVFWEAAEDVVKAFGFMFSESWGVAKRFFSQLLRTGTSAMRALVLAIANPAMAGTILGAELGALANTKVDFTISGNAQAARDELAAIKLEIDALTKEAEDARSQASGDATAGLDENAAAAAAAAAGVEVTPEVDREAERIASAFERATEAIQNEIVALEQGEAAAERFRLAQQGLNEEQINAVMALREKQKELKQAADDEEKARNEKKAEEQDEANRLKGLQEEARRLQEELRTPQEILNDRLKKIAELQDSGGLSDETALRAEDRARRDFKEANERDEKRQLEEQGTIRNRSSVATNSLMALSAMASSPKDRIGEQQLKKADEQIGRLDRVIVGIEKLGLFHA